MYTRITKTEIEYRNDGDNMDPDTIYSIRDLKAITEIEEDEE